MSYTGLREGGYLAFGSDFAFEFPHLSSVGSLSLRKAEIKATKYP